MYEKNYSKIDTSKKIFFKFVDTFELNENLNWIEMKMLEVIVESSH